MVFALLVVSTTCIKIFPEKPLKPKSRGDILLPTSKPTALIFCENEVWNDNDRKKMKKCLFIKIEGLINNNGYSTR